MMNMYRGVVLVWAVLLLSSSADAFWGRPLSKPKSKSKSCFFKIDLISGESVFYMDSTFQREVQNLVKNTFTVVNGCSPPSQSGTSCFSYSYGRKKVKGCNIHLGFECGLSKGNACTDIDASSLEGKAVPTMLSDAYVKTASVGAVGALSNGKSERMPEPPEHSFVGVNEDKKEQL